MKNILIVVFALLVISCKDSKTQNTNVSLSDEIIGNTKLKDSSQGFYKSEKNIFLGDSILAIKNYFDHLTDDNGYSILKKQNNFYFKNYSAFINSDMPQIGSNRNVQLKFEKQLITNKAKYRIVLYTFLNNKKTDSIEFYRNVDDLEYEPSNYTCLSYLDLKDKRIWQIKYFSSSVDKSVGYVLYEKSKVMENGKIKSDSLFYLDESLDVEMEKSKLYY